MTRPRRPVGQGAPIPTDQQTLRAAASEAEGLHTEAGHLESREWFSVSGVEHHDRLAEMTAQGQPGAIVAHSD